MQSTKERATPASVTLRFPSLSQSPNRKKVLQVQEYPKPCSLSSSDSGFQPKHQAHWVEFQQYHHSIKNPVGAEVESPPPRLWRGGGAASEAAQAACPVLVNRFISQQDRKSGNAVKSLQVYHRAVRMVREYRGKDVVPPGQTRGEISSFSEASRRRLKFTASNAFPVLKTQFGMTYHENEPDGRTIKKHLNAFLVAVRRMYPNFGYLWILEFQKRGKAHFHLYTSLEHKQAIGFELSILWNRIAEPESGYHLRWHCHKKNFIAWDMGSGSYLCKYLAKESQKAVPVGFTGVGRFWGNSRGLVPPPDEVDMEDIVETHGEYTGKYIVRTLCRHHENSLASSPWKSSARTRPTSYTLGNGSVIARRLFSYLQEKPPLLSPPPF